jgi:hypothetical protein
MASEPNQKGSLVLSAAMRSAGAFFRESWRESTQGITFRKNPGIHLAGVGFVLLVISIAVSNSGMEIGKGLILFGGLLTGILALVRKEPLDLKRFLSPGFLLLAAWILSWALSVVFTEDWGSARTGTLRVLPVQAALLAFTVVVAAWRRPWPWRMVLPLFVVACAVCFAYSIAMHGDGRSHGFLGNPVSYSHVLGGMLAALSCLWVWIMAGRGPYASTKGKVLSLVGVSLVLLLGFFDLAVNQSRSLLLPLFLIPTLLFLFATATRKKVWLALPLFLILLSLAAPKAVVDRLLSRVRFWTSSETLWMPTRAVREGDQMTLTGPLTDPCEAVTTIEVNAFPLRHIVCGMLEKSNGQGTLRIDLPERYRRPPMNLRVVIRADRGRIQESWLALGPLSGETAQIPRVLSTETAVEVGSGLPQIREAIRRGGLGSLRVDFFDQDRRWVWWSSMEMAGRHPWLGVGPGNWRWASLRGDQSGTSPFFGTEIAPFYNYFHAHNNFLNLAAESGLPAALLYGALVLWLLARGLWIPIGLRPRLAVLARLARTPASARRVAVSARSAFIHFSLALILLTITLSGIFDYTVFSIAGHLSALCMGLLIARDGVGARIRMSSH